MHKHPDERNEVKNCWVTILTPNGDRWLEDSHRLDRPTAERCVTHCNPADKPEIVECVTSPGPFKIGDRPDKFRVQIDAIGHYAIAEVIVAMDEWGDGAEAKASDHLEANARLFASAWELLEAAKSALPLLPANHPLHALVARVEKERV